ncbi:hypothetical protein [Haloferula sp. BvORR071]|uniref:hypothetical protein n=1 Tax=Haloferula sp. BvORR071 TaxID=1396141 RepID=UPI000556AB88|nr:hypothetical protein [Haloferula sp. BvORR071]
MNQFTLLVLFVVFALFAGTVAGVLALWFGRKKSWMARGLMLLACYIPAALGIVAISSLFGSTDLSDPADLRDAYHTEFAEDPPPDVSTIQCRHSSAADTMSAWLRFQASPQTVDKLLRRFTPSDRLDFDDSSVGDNVPPWWQPDKESMVYFYRAEKWRSDFGGSVAVLAHDAAKGLVYFHHTGVD